MEPTRSRRVVLQIVAPLRLVGVVLEVRDRVRGVRRTVVQRYRREPLARKLQHGAPPEPLEAVLTAETSVAVAVRAPVGTDHEAVRAATFDQVTAALRAGGVPHLVVPAQPGQGRRVGVPHVAWQRAVDQLIDAMPPTTWVTLYHGAGGEPGRPARAAMPRVRRRAHRASMMTLFTHRGRDGWSVLAAEGGCEVERWVDGERRGWLEPVHWNRSVAEARVSWFTPDGASKVGGLDQLAPYASDVGFPVDVVYTWVDGDDPDWRARRARVLGDLDPSSFNEDATQRARFESRDELRYSLRSLELYAPFVNHVYLVTAGQRPAWLVDAHPRLTVVDHSEIIDADHLPTFNSHAIEACLHRIPGLNEHYLYLNDDFLFGRPVTAEAFFEGNGTARFFYSRALMPVGKPDVSTKPVDAAAMNGRALIEQRWGVTVSRKFKHAPYPQLRSVLDDIDRWFPAEVARTRASRVRDPADLALASSFHHYVAYFTCRASAGAIRSSYVDLADPRLEPLLDSHLAGSRFDTICLNDTLTSDDDFERSAALLAAFLDRKFPSPSSFER